MKYFVALVKTKFLLIDFFYMLQFDLEWRYPYGNIQFVESELGVKLSQYVVADRLLTSVTIYYLL